MHSFFPIRCQDRGIHDAKTCIITELSQDGPDGLRFGPIAEIEFTNLHGIRTILMAISIDDCRRVDWTKPVGPLDLPDRKVPNASIENIVQELFLLQPRDAIALAMNNALASAQEARAFLNKAAPLTAGQTLDFSLELEADLKNATIKMIDDILCKGLGGVGTTWIAIEGSALLGLGTPSLSGDQSLVFGALATLSLLTQNAVVDFLRTALDEDILYIAAYRWVLWIILSITSRTTELVRNLPPLPRYIDRAAVRRALVDLVRSDHGVEIPRLGLTTWNSAINPSPAVCDMV